MITITDMREDRSPMFLSRHERAGGNGARTDSREDTRRAGGGERSGAHRRTPASNDSDVVDRAHRMLENGPPGSSWPT